MLSDTFSNRRLDARDAGALEALAPFPADGLRPCYELTIPRNYVWWGVFSGTRLIAAHRGLRWGDSLMLKGLYVAKEYLGTSAGLQAAFAVRDFARSEGYCSAVAWVELAKPERHIATRLRLALNGPALHRLAFPVFDHDPEMSPQVPAEQNLICGTLSVGMTESPLVENMLAPSGSGASEFAYVLDQNRIVLSGNPCREASDIPLLLEKVEPVARLLQVGTLEIPVPASDIARLFAFAACGGQRLSRTPVMLGQHVFGRGNKANTSKPKTLIGVD